jgi:hypothetical protein
MVMATPNSSNDAILNEHLNLTRDASIANLEQKSSEVQQEYRDEAAKIADQKQRSAEVVQGTLDAARENAALRSEAEYNQAFKNFQATQDLAMRTSAANPRDTKLPLELHRQVVDSTHKFMAAQADYVSTHPDRASDPNYNIRLAEDGNGGFQLVNGLDPGLAQQAAIASPDQRQVNPNEPLARLVDQPDGSFDLVLQTGETFKNFKGAENREAVRRLGESKVQTRRHYEALARQLPQPQQPANGQQSQQPTNGQHTDPALNANQTFDSQAYLREETAKALGFNDAAEMVADYRFMREQAEKYRILELSSSFQSQNQDFPNTTQAVEALEAVCRANNWDMENIDNLSAAHAVAVRQRLYQPLSQQEIALANGYPPEVRRPVPPPIPRGGSPESATPVQDLYEMPLDQLRKQILAGQTGGR